MTTTEQRWIVMSEAEAAAWRPEIVGWSDDILPFYRSVVPTLPPGARVVEIGVAHGRSTLFLAEELARLGRDDVEFTAVDILELPEALRQPPRPVRYLRCASALAAQFFADNSIDFAFIDADHSREGVLEDLRAWEPKIRSGGILAGHDYQVQDWPGVVQAVDETFGQARVAHPTRTVWAYRFPGHGAIG